MKYWFPGLLFFLFNCSTGTQTSDTRPADRSLKSEVYEREIKTVRIYPLLNDTYQELFPAVAELGRNTLILEFDDLIEGTENYYARLIHCNSDWTQSRLSPLQYVEGFNEFPLNEFEFSAGTKIPYIHYTFKVPQVKIPGNYIVEVYRNTTDEIVLRQRIMYYQDLVKIKSEDLASGFIPGRLNQRINFVVDYSDYDLIDPMQRTTAIIRQNDRWDNSVFNLRPTFIRPEINELEYQYFDSKNMFSGGNEFRAFDIRSVNTAGANVQRLQLGDTTTAILMLDKPRDYQAYSLDRDLNGNYVISNYDQGNDLYGAEYINVIFTLNTGRKFLGNIYIHGALSNWETEQFNKMNYVESLQSYQGNLLLKQGWYNYQYLLKNDTLPSNFIEGEHFETENNYDILFYYRSINLDADILIGYSRWRVNPQF